MVNNGNSWIIDIKGHSTELPNYKHFKTFDVYVEFENILNLSTLFKNQCPLERNPTHVIRLQKNTSLTFKKLVSMYIEKALIKGSCMFS